MTKPQAALCLFGLFLAYEAVKGAVSWNAFLFFVGFCFVVAILIAILRNIKAILRGIAVLAVFYGLYLYFASH